VLKTSGFISSCYIGSRKGRGLVGRGEVGQWVAGESGTVGRRRKGTVGRRARRSRGARGTGGSRDVRRRVGCEARGTGVRRGAVSEGESIPRRMSRPPGVSGGKRGRRGEKDVRRCRPTFHRRAHSRRWGDSRGGVGPRYTDGPTLDRKGVAGGGDHPRCTDEHTFSGGSGGREGWEW
jgi:hypothetical protein